MVDAKFTARADVFHIFRAKVYNNALGTKEKHSFFVGVVEIGNVLSNCRRVLLEGTPYENVLCHKLSVPSNQRHELDECLADEAYSSPFARLVAEGLREPGEHSYHPINALRCTRIRNKIRLFGPLGVIVSRTTNRRDTHRSVVGKEQRIRRLAFHEQIEVVAPNLRSRQDHRHEEHDRGGPIHDRGRRGQVAFLGEQPACVEEERRDAEAEEVERDVQAQQRDAEVAEGHHRRGFQRPRSVHEASSRGNRGCCRRVGGSLPEFIHFERVIAKARARNNGCENRRNEHRGGKESRRTEHLRFRLPNLKKTGISISNLRILERRHEERGIRSGALLVRFALAEPASNDAPAPTTNIAPAK